MTTNNPNNAIVRNFGHGVIGSVGVAPVMAHCGAGMCNFAAPDGSPEFDHHVQDCAARKAIRKATAAHASKAPSQGRLNGWRYGARSAECIFGCGQQTIEGWAHSCNGAPTPSSEIDVEAHQLASRLKAAGWKLVREDGQS